MFKTLEEKKLLSNFIHLFSLQGLTFIIPLISSPYLFRTLGAEKFGLVSFSLVVIAFLRIIVDYGFQLTATREVALHKGNKQKLSIIFSQVMLTKFILLILTLIILSILILTIDIFHNNWILFYASFLFVVGHALFPMWFFQGIEEMKYISYLNIISKGFFLISILLFIHSPNDYLYYPVFNGVGVIIVGLYSLNIIKNKYHIQFIGQSYNDIKKLIVNGWSIFLGEVAPALYNNFSTFLLGFFVSMESVGYLTLANRLVSAATSIIYIARNVTFPYLNRNFYQFKKITFLIISMGIIFTLFLLVFGKYIVIFLFGEKESLSILHLVYLLSISPILYSIILSFGSNYLLVLKKDSLYKKIIIYTSFLGIFFSLILVPIFQLNGAVFTILSVQFITALLLIKYAYVKDKDIPCSNK